MTLFFYIVIGGGLIALSTWLIVGIVKDIRSIRLMRKNAKSSKKEERVEID